MPVPHLEKCACTCRNKKNGSTLSMYIQQASRMSGESSHFQRFLLWTSKQIKNCCALTSHCFKELAALQEKTNTHTCGLNLHGHRPVPVCAHWFGTDSHSVYSVFVNEQELTYTSLFLICVSVTISGNHGNCNNSRTLCCLQLHQY